MSRLSFLSYARLIDHRSLLISRQVKDREKRRDPVTCEPVINFLEKTGSPEDQALDEEKKANGKTFWILLSSLHYA